MTDESRREKRGAPRNNLNAFKHGYYSRLFRPLEADDLEAILRDGLEDEIAMLRVITRRVFELADNQEDIESSIKTLSALGVAATRLARLLEAQKSLGGGDRTLQMLSQALNEIRDERRDKWQNKA
jgi:hypothetical protein